MNQIYTGVVENRMDPLKLGRCQVRVLGLHTYDKAILPTEDLPWAVPLQSITSAAMNGIGHSPVGPVEGTSVILIFADAPENQQPIMIGSLGGIPQQKNTVIGANEEPTSLIANPNTGTSEQVPSNDEEAKNLDADAPTTPNATQPAAAETPATDIPTVPPPGTPQKEKATAGIKAILAACDKFGLKTKEQKCSLLAIAGGESLWVPKEEGYSYSKEALMSTFPSTFGGKPDLAAQYARWKGSRESFFDFVYAPENNGRRLGNTQPGDGGKYYGRGFNGVTGRANYDKFGKLAGVDIINNPLLLTNDIKVAAEVFCQMVINNPIVKKAIPTANPDYFYAVKKGNGHDTGTGAEVRLKYYEYFYGGTLPASSTQEKSAAAEPPPSTIGASGATGIVAAGPSTSGSGPIGFKDPNNKYPLKKYLKEADTNRLSRGVKNGTVHPTKDSNRAESIPIALSDITFDEPPTSFAAKYPYNHVFESESGHVQEFDDTPNHERVMTYHRKGTFTEVDPNGTKVTHIVGDNYHIMDRNGYIFVNGEATLTVNGNINILCKSDTNIEVTGDANVEVGNNANVGIAKNANMVVGENMKLQVNRTLDIKANAINMESATSFNIRASTLSETGSVINVNAGTYRETVGTSFYRWNGDKYVWTGADTFSRHDSGTDHGCPSDPPRDSSQACPNVTSASPAASANTGLTAPEVGIVVPSILERLESPPSEGEELFLVETEEDWDTPAGRALQAANEKQYGSETPLAQDESAATGGTDNTVVASCQAIYGIQEFTNDFRLSANFTLGMLIDGGVNGKNKLRDQNGLTKQQIVCNLSQLCQNVYEPLLAVLPGGIGGYGKQWKINSGYRISSNIPSGGAAKSDHMLGRATDMTLLPYGPNKAKLNFDFATQIEKLIPYDQIIMEYMPGGSNWVHIGYRGVKEGDTAGGGVNRKMAFTMYNGKTIKRDGFLLQ